MKPSRFHCTLRLSVLLLGLLSLTGCFSLYQRDHSSRSSLMEFLYPDQTDYFEEQATPHLRLPLRVGVAFTPDVQRGVGGFTEVHKAELANQVAADFRQLGYVRHIEIIPGEYLRPRGSFENLDQLRNMFGIDVIVLLSHDQQVFTDEGFAALTYWTIVGAYTVPGEKNDTHTLLDAAVYDIESRKLLFRAPGTSTVNSRGTLVANSEQLRDDSIVGFELAGTLLARNLETELDAFNTRIRETPDEVQISRRPGYVGAGSTDILFLFMIGMLASVFAVRSRRSAR